MSLTSRLEAIKKENAKVNSNTLDTNPVLSNISLFKKLEGIKANNVARTPQQTSLPPAFDATSAYSNPNTQSLNTSYQTANPPVAPPASDPRLSLFPNQPKPGFDSLSQNLGNIQTGLGKITGWAGEKLGQVIGGIEGFALGGLTGSMKPTDIKSNLYRAIDQSKKSAKDTGAFGRQVGTAGGELIPGILKRVVDFTPTAAKVMVGREEDMISYAADKFLEKYNSDIPFLTKSGAPQITKDQAKNYLLTGNFEGDQSKTDKYEVTKAWASSLFDIGLDLSMVGDIAAGALKGYYAKNVNKGYKPFLYTKTDFDNGLIQNVTSQGIKETRFTPQPGMGTMEVTAGAPTIGRRLTQDIFPLRGQGRVVAGRTPSTAMTTTARQAEAPIMSEAGAVTQVAKGTPELAAGAVRPQVAGPAIQSALPAGTPGSRPNLAPVDNPNAAFQIIDPVQAKVAQSLVKKLEATLKQKTAVMQENPTKAAVESVKKLQTTINDLQTQIDTVRANQNITTGPLVNRGQTTVAPIEKPASALVAEKKITTPTIVSEPKKGIQYNVDRSGNVSIKSERTPTEALSSKEVTQYKRALDTLVEKNKITPKEAKTLLTQKINPKQVEIIKTSVTAKKELPTNIKSRLEAQATPKQKSEWQRLQITKEEYDALQRRKTLQKEKMETQKKYKDLQAQAIARQKAKDLQLVADAKVRISKIRAENAKKKEQEAIALKACTSVINGCLASACNQRTSTKTRKRIKPYSLKIGRKSSTLLA